jgi:hypothetical protein
MCGQIRTRSFLLFDALAQDADETISLYARLEEVDRKVVYFKRNVTYS